MVDSELKAQLTVALKAAAKPTRFRVHDITGVDTNMVEFAAVIEQSVRVVAKGVRGLCISDTSE